MMRRAPMVRPLLVLALFAFVALGVVAVLPHTHDAAGAHPHACVVCRAHSAAPYLVPVISVRPVFQPARGAILDAVVPWVSQYVVTLPASRAPPILA